MPEPEPSVQEPIAASVLSGLVQDKPSAKPDGIEANVSEAGPVDEAHEPPPAVVEPQRAEAPAEQQAGQRHAPHEEGETEERWYMKRIYWPPLPRLPSGHQADLPSVRIICQNRNGPCSLLALCAYLQMPNEWPLTSSCAGNILILRHEIFIPHRLEYVTYSDLSNIIADYLLAHPSPRLSLERALKVLPTTQYGLSLNPRFGSIDGFAPLFPATDAEGPAKESDEVLLFAACGIQLVHGWLPDPQDDESWRVLVEQHGDYDEVIKAMIEGEEIGGPRPSDHDAPDVAALIVDRWTSLSPADRLKVRDASTIRSFLDNSSTQITINGLFRLSELAPNSLVALFRNSHLSVLFVRPPSPDEHVERTTPKLFELVTDEGMRDSLVVWESLVDTSGAGDWYDASLKRISGNKCVSLSLLCARRGFD